MILPAQPYGQPDTSMPGDSSIQSYLATEADRIHATFFDDIQSLDDWNRLKPRFQEEYLYMLGLSPMPERTPLQSTLTGTLERDGYKVEKIHYQSSPGLYVTANLYRPSNIPEGKKLPAVLYVCGHALQGKAGNKTAYQSHGIWFAKHGYICLMVDTLQLGEIASIHHGTYRENRWWWHSRGYTSAGVECWNGIRGIDYLTNRSDVDPSRIAVTGISGGGAATFWIAAADPRVAVAVPVSGMADLPSYVNNRVVNGHCDCMFLYNTFQWPWARIAGLIAPRPMLFVNSDNDNIFPMDANDRVINRLERVYSLYGKSDLVDAMVSIGGHAYREDLRKASFRFLNTHLKHQPQEVTDSEQDLVTGPRSNRSYPIPIDDLRVFPEGQSLPADQKNTTIDEIFVPMAKVAPPAKGQFDSWKKDLRSKLKEVTFRTIPDDVRPATLFASDTKDAWLVETEPMITLPLRLLPGSTPMKQVSRILLVVQGNESDAQIDEMMNGLKKQGDAVYALQVRGYGPTEWTRKNPPNYVERSLVLLGQTADTGRVRDVISTAKSLMQRHGKGTPVHLAGKEGSGLIAAYAALLDPEIAAVLLIDPPSSHMQKQAPQFLNVLRVCDVPVALGMLAPRPLTLITTDNSTFKLTKEIYQAARADHQFLSKSNP